MRSVWASTNAFWLPMPPNPTMATFTVSLGARWPRPSTRLGRISGATAAIAPMVALPAPTTNSRRVRSFLFDISMLLSLVWDVDAAYTFVLLALSKYRIEAEGHKKILVEFAAQP